MLQVLCERALVANPPSLELDGTGMLGLSAQFWAVHLVHSLNMTIYLGVEDQFSGICDVHAPSITQMLYILHPYHPQSGGAAEAQSIIYYCYGLLNCQRNPWAIVATLLSRTIGVVMTTDFSDSHAILVPGIMSRFFHFYPLAKSEPGCPRAPTDDIEQYWIIGFVSYSLDRNGSKLSYDVWDQLKSLSSKSESQLEQRFFKPLQIENPHTSPSWELIDLPVSVIRHVSLCTSGNTSVGPLKLREESLDVEGILGLLICYILGGIGSK